MILYKNGKIYNIQRESYESRSCFLQRCWLIVNADMTVADSLIWSFKQYKNCSYFQDKEREIVEAKQKQYQ